MRSAYSLLYSPVWLVAVLVPWLAMSAAAAPTDPVDVVPGFGTVFFPPAFSPGFRQVGDLEQDYIEKEFFVIGAATLYNYANNPPLGPTDIVPIQEDVPYKTRIIVRRPALPEDFNGTVVVEWWNSTAGFDTAPVWDTSAEYFARQGIIYVGVTNSTTAIDFLVGECRLFGILPPSCRRRYASLSFPENGLAFEMMSQIANVLKGTSSENPIPATYEVERLYHAGQSQQGGSLVTYASAFHLDGVNDGYFVQQAATGRAINFGPACGADGSPPFPDCTPRLVFPDSLVRTDLPVPVVHAISETDIEILFGTVGRQADTPTFRYYEIAGGSHLTVHKDVEVVPGGLIGPFPIFLADLCAAPINSTADGPVYVSYVFNALWENMDQQVRKGTEPPAGLLMDVQSGVVQRDEHGNGLGGIRLPALTVPTATYTPGNVGDPGLPPFLRFIGNLACQLASSVEVFDFETQQALNPNHGQYVSSVVQAANALRFDGFLLSEDREKIVEAAAESSIGCGLGFELVFLLPPLMWLRQRRRENGI